MRELEEIKQELKDIVNRITIIQNRLDKKGYVPTSLRRTVMEIITAFSSYNNEVEIEKIYKACEKEGLSRDVTDKNLERLKGMGEIFEPKRGYISKL